MRAFAASRMPLRQYLAAPLIRNLAAVIGGTVIAQSIVFLFSPLITRIYSPEAFGLQGVFLALISVLWPVVALRYPMAIVVAESEAEVQGLIRLSLWIAASIAAAIALVIGLFRSRLAPLLGVEQLDGLIWFLPLALVLVAAQDVMDFRATRAEAFRTIGMTSAVQALAVNSARIIGGLVHPVASVLVIITSLSYGLQALLLRTCVKIQSVPARTEPRPRATELLRKYRDFPLYRAPADVVNALAQATPVFLLSSLFSPAAAGLYVLARGAVNLPLNLIGSAAGNVFYARIAEKARRGEPLFPFVMKATLMQLAVPGGAVLLAALIFPDLFALVFGEEWRTSGHYARWMSLWVVGMLANIPSVRALPVIGRQKVHLLFNALIMAGGVLGMMLGREAFGSALGAVAAYSVVTMMLYGLQIATYLYQVRSYDRSETLDA